LLLQLNGGSSGAPLPQLNHHFKMYFSYLKINIFIEYLEKHPGEKDCHDYERDPNYDYIQS